MTGQFGGENIQEKFTKNSAKNSRNAVYHQEQFDGSESPTGNDMLSPFNPNSNRAALKEKFAVKS